MPAYTKPADQWLGGQLAQLKGTVAQLNNGGTEYVVEVPQRKAGETQKESERPTTVAILGDVSHDFQGLSTGLSGWGIAVRAGGEWSKVAGTADSGWQSAELKNSWAKNGTPAVGYRKQGNVVRFRGRVQGGLSNKTIFTLPEGFRPAQETFGIVPTEGFGLSDIIISTAGEVTPEFSGAGGTYTVLDGITFTID